MNFGGWVIMISSLVFVTVFFVGSLYIVIRRGSKSNQLHSTFDETPDMKKNDH